MSNKYSIINTHFIQTTPSTMKKTIYLTGPSENFTEYELATQFIKDFGFKNVINPHEVCKDVDPKIYPTKELYLEHCQRLRIAEMVAFANMIVTLYGWEKNPEAKKEVAIARALGFIKVQSIVELVGSNNS